MRCLTTPGFVGAQGQFEAEVEAYRRHLEELYALCSSCDVEVKRTLLLQDALLRPLLVGHPALTRWQVLARCSLVSGPPLPPSPSFASARPR